MKKTILLLGILVLSVSFSFGQFAEKGSMLFNGSVSYYTGKVKNESASFTSEYTATHLNLTPAFQYFVINNLAIGALLSASSSTDKYDDGSKYTDSDLIFAPVVRYYVWNALFAQAYYGFGSNKSKVETPNGNSDTKNKVSEWAFMGGYSVRITDTVLFDPMVGYRKNVVTDDADGATKIKTGQVCIQLGFTILFNK